MPLDLKVLLVLPVQLVLKESLVRQDQLVPLAHKGQPATREQQVQQEAQELRVQLAIQVLQEVQDLPEQLAAQAQQDRLVLLAHKVLQEIPVPQDLQVPQALQA